MAREEAKKSQKDVRANRSILTRTLILMGMFGIVSFIPLFYQLWDVQITNHDKYQQLAIDQQTRDLAVTAPRGTIYDAKGNILAISATVQNVVISPKEILEGEAAAEKAKAAGKTYNEKMNAEFISTGLAAILGQEPAEILKHMEKTTSQYEVLAWRVEDAVSTQVNTFIKENKLYPGVNLRPDTKRYYPYGSLGAQVIGWVNMNDGNKGAYGLEALCESELAGQAGRVVTAKNAAGTEMLSSYEDYVDEVAGYDLTVTLDATIQNYCQRILDEGIASYEVRKGGFCIAMNPKTGAILGMVSNPTYDLNTPREIGDPILSAYLEALKTDTTPTGEEAYKTALQNAQYQQWSNRAVTDTYEPGSTFKAVVLAAALEEGVVSDNSSFTCTGRKRVADWDIKCSKLSGHGEQNLAKAVANSCNPAFIEIGQALGAEKFYRYLENFGIIGKTGIDLQGESSNAALVWKKDYFTSTEGIASLASASFGQTFRLTPIQLITAACATVNGGHLMQPYVLQSVTDGNGNIVRQTQPTEIRQVVSEATSAKVRTILEGVVDGGTGKNARVEGYRFAGKTGTSQKRDETTGDLIVSFLGIAPADDPQVVILLAYDSPTPASPGALTTSRDIYISGGNMGATMAGELMANIMDYIGVEKQYNGAAVADVVMPQTVGLSQAEAKTLLKSKGFSLRAVGEGAVVTGQLPVQGTLAPAGSKVVLYMGSEKPTEKVTVPDLVGKSPSAAQAALEAIGLYMRATGVTENYTATTIAMTQGLAAGSQADPGAVIEVHFADTQVQDFAAN